jgi:hypothetical protein
MLARTAPSASNYERDTVNDGAVVTSMRTVETPMSHTGDAALVSDVCSFRFGGPGICANLGVGIAQVR